MLRSVEMLLASSFHLWWFINQNTDMKTGQQEAITTWYMIARQTGGLTRARLKHGFSKFIPSIRKHQGKQVVMIGDNLGSHFSPKVIGTCVENNIIFICLPPNTTHL